MLEDDTDHEPEPDGRQFDAVTRFEEPEPGTEPSGPSIPDAADREGDAHPRVRLLFWALVGVFNLALLAIGVGVLMFVFTDAAVLALQITAAGVVLFVYGGYRYRRAKREVATLAGDEEKG